MQTVQHLFHLESRKNVELYTLSHRLGQWSALSLSLDSRDSGYAVFWRLIECTNDGHSGPIAGPAAVIRLVAVVG